LIAWAATVFPHEIRAAPTTDRDGNAGLVIDESARTLVARLADQDPAARQAAEEKLLSLGAAARRDVLAASRSDNPAIAARASQILLKLSWSRPDDPPPVRRILNDYGARDEAGRVQALTQFVDLPPAMSVPVLIRLMSEDPSDDVCWHAANMLAPRIDRPATLQLRKLDPAKMQPAALVLVGQAWIGKDRVRALTMLRLAVDAETSNPSYDGGGLDYAFDQLAQAAVTARRYDEAADLRRLQAARIGTSRDAFPTPVFELLALHARFGPLEGFESDVARFGEYLGQPQSLYVIGKLYERCGQRALARAFFTAASAASLTPTHRFLVARFLREQGWNDLAEPELHALAARDNERDDAPGAFNANIILAMMAQEPGGDDSAAADYYEAACRVLVARREAVNPTELLEYLNEQIALHRFLAARAAHDDAAARGFADRLIELKPARSEPLVELIPYLRSVGRDSDAQQLFDRAYVAAQERSVQDPDDPSSLNEIAWLFARTGEHPKEALELATRAVAQEPDTAAYLDTAAEASFRCGKVHEAISLEHRALELEPDKTFFAAQLARFERAGAR
jgi:hypothetical protein